MPQRRLHWLAVAAAVLLCGLKLYTHIHTRKTYTCTPLYSCTPHTHTPFAIALQSCNAIRFYVASAVAASALKQLPLHAVVAVLVAVAMTVTTACALLSTRHAKILQQQQQQLCQLLVGSAKGASSDLFA